MSDYIEQMLLTERLKTERAATITIPRAQYDALMAAVRDYNSARLEIHGHRNGAVCECDACKRDRNIAACRAAGIKIEGEGK